MVKKATKEVSREELLDQALQMHNDGRKMQEILDEVQLNYSAVWLYIQSQTLDTKEFVAPKDRTPATVRKLRDGGDSWGLIQVKFGYTEYSEGKIRKMYEEVSGVKSQGLRIGKGGKFLNNDPVLYLEDRKVTGIALKVGTPRSELAEISSKLRKGLPAGVRPTKKAARSNGAVKKAAKKAVPTKKALARKAVKNG